MVAVIFIYKINVGKSTDYMSVEPNVKLSGEVTQVSETAASLAVTIKDVSVAYGTGVRSYEKILCYIKSDKSNNQYNETINNNNSYYQDEIGIGNKISMSGVAESFLLPTNDGQFNAYKYYREKDYAYMIYVEDYLITDSEYNFYEKLRRLTDKCISVYTRFLPEEDVGIIAAMVFGQKSYLSEDDRELYKINGLMHILAVSGMHISIVSLMLIFIITRCPVKYKTGRLMMFILLLIYAVMTGFGVSCIRAVIMFGVRLLAELTGRTYDVLSSLSLAAIITLLFNPRVLFHCDFILSYLAVIAISVVYPVFAEKFDADKGIRQVIEKMLIKPCLLSMCTWVVTMPAVLYFYYEIPIYSIVVNPIVIPFVSVLFIISWLIVPAGFILPGLTLFLAGSVHVILELYRLICEFCLDYIYDMRIVGFPSWLKIIFCYVFMLLIILNYRKISRNKTGIIVLMLFMAVPVSVMNYQKTGEFKISFLDVGQGDGIVMTLPDGNTVCIDCGSSDVSDLAKYRLEPFLSYNGIKNIDCFVISHIDKDHYSGLKELLERNKYNGVDIGTIVIANSEICRDEYMNIFDDIRHSTKVESINKGQKIIYGDVSFTCLSPHDEEMYNNQNDSSVVLKMTYGNFNALFTGDISDDVEIKLLENGLVGDKMYDLLKVAHHGSKDSSCERFLRAVKPKIAVVSCGADNGYGHPHEETMKRLGDYADKVYVTAEDGLVEIR